MNERRCLIVTAVEREAACVRAGLVGDGARVIAGGIGRTNAAAATTEAILRSGPFDVVVSAGVAGALPGSDLEIGDVVVASSCVYAEEGLITPTGFQDMREMGFALGDFQGNVVPVDPELHRRLARLFPTGPIATVATCSGTDEAAMMVARRTDAVAEAMEGAAVVHAARRLGAAAIELRAISNTTGNRGRQAWDLGKAFAALEAAAAKAVEGACG